MIPRYYFVFLEDGCDTEEKARGMAKIPESVHYRGVWRAPTPDPVRGHLFCDRELHPDEMLIEEGWRRG